MKQLAYCVLALIVASPPLAAEPEISSLFVEDGLHVSGGHFESSSLGFVTACGYEPNRSKLDILQHGNVVATLDIPGFSAKGISVFDIADLEEPGNEFSFFVSGATGEEQYISRLYRWSAQVLELLWSSEHLGLDSATETGCEISTNGSGTLWLSLCKTDQSLGVSVGRFSEYEAFYHTIFEISSTPRGDETFDYPSIAVINDEPRTLQLALLWDGRITILGTPEQPRLANLATPLNSGTIVWRKESARARWQKSIATHCVQQVKPLAPRSARCFLTSAARVD